jgi:hypothetical protein
MPTLRSINGEPLVPVLQEDAAVGTDNEAVNPCVTEVVAPSPPGMVMESLGAVTVTQPPPPCSMTS